jgi:hypothetical protein
MVTPVCIEANSFQIVWLRALRHLEHNGWDTFNLMVSIKDPCAFDVPMDAEFTALCHRHRLLTPEQVCYTIFPQGLYERYPSCADLMHQYNRRNGFYERIRKPRHGVRWGTYFRRLTHYETANGAVNQLDRIIQAIKGQPVARVGAYTMVIQQPGGETTRPRGGPCLNYVAVQMQRGTPRRIGLLAVYRNHDFVRKAYGNYLGLCRLLQFIARETETQPEWVTCVSSHAYANELHPQLQELVSTWL